MDDTDTLYGEEEGKTRGLRANTQGLTLTENDPLIWFNIPLFV